MATDSQPPGSPESDSLGSPGSDSSPESPGSPGSDSPGSPGSDSQTPNEVLDSLEIPVFHQDLGKPAFPRSISIESQNSSVILDGERKGRERSTGEGDQKEEKLGETKVERGPGRAGQGGKNVEDLDRGEWEMIISDHR